MANPTMAELTTRVKAAGFDYLTDATVNQFVQEAALEVLDAERWSWRFWETTESVTNLAANGVSGIILQVRRASDGRVVLPAREEELRDSYPDLDVSGEPRFYYSRVVGTDVGVTTEDRRELHFTPKPAGGIEFEVMHLHRWPWLNAGSPVQVYSATTNNLHMPSRFEVAVVQRARLKCKEHTDGWEDYANLAQVHELELQSLREAFLWTQEDEPDEVRVEETH